MNASFLPAPSKLSTLSLRRMALCAAAFSLASSVWAADNSTPHDITTPPPRPTLAVAMGDDFASGSGAQNTLVGYEPIFITGELVNYYYTTQINRWDGSFSEEGSAPYRCYRSTIAPFDRAFFPGITNRANIACASAIPEDLAHSSLTRGQTHSNTDTFGNKVTGFIAVPSQLSRLKTLALANDVKLIHLSIGINSNWWGNGDKREVSYSWNLMNCAGTFKNDARDNSFWNTDVWPVNGIAHLDSGEPCHVDSLTFPRTNYLAGSGSPNVLEPFTSSVVGPIQSVTGVMASAGYQPQDYRLVLSTYPKSFPDQFNSYFHTYHGELETDVRFRDLADLRYFYGCGIHEETAARFNKHVEGVNDAVSYAAAWLQQRGYNVVLMEAENAFAGGRLCEEVKAPNQGTHLVRPLQIRDKNWASTNSALMPSMVGLPLDIHDRCITEPWRCDQAGQPNFWGNIVLAQCLQAAATTTSKVLACRRSNGVTVTEGYCSAKVNWYDGTQKQPGWDYANCLVTSVPAGKVGFVANNSYYVQKTANCPASAPFDQTGCKFSQVMSMSNMAYSIGTNATGSKIALHIRETSGVGPPAPCPANFTSTLYQRPIRECEATPPAGTTAAQARLVGEKIYVGNASSTCSVGNVQAQGCWLGNAPAGKVAFKLGGSFYYQEN